MKVQSSGVGRGADFPIHLLVIRSPHHQGHAVQILRGKVVLNELNAPLGRKFSQARGQGLADHGHPGSGGQQVLHFAFPHCAAPHHQAGAILDEGKQGIGFHAGSCWVC